MSQTIHKYRLPAAHAVVTLRLPAGAQLLSVGCDFLGHAALWAVVPLPEPKALPDAGAFVGRRLAVCFTGMAIPAEVPAAAIIAATHGTRAREGAFLGTVTTPSGSVLHVFDLGEV